MTDTYLPSEISEIWLYFFFPSPALYFIKSSMFMSGNSGGIHVLVKVAQSCLTLCNPMDYTFNGIFQTRILKWVAFLFSRGSSQPRDQTQISNTAGGFFTSWVTRESKEGRKFIYLIRMSSTGFSIITYKVGINLHNILDHVN